MENVNLTKLYLGLIEKCNVTGFELSSIRKVDSIKPVDAKINFKVVDIQSVDLEMARSVLAYCITGEVKQSTIKLKDDSIEIYIEFIGHDVSHWDSQ